MKAGGRICSKSNPYDVRSLLFRIRNLSRGSKTYLYREPMFHNIKCKLN